MSEHLETKREQHSGDTSESAEMPQEEDNNDTVTIIGGKPNLFRKCSHTALRNLEDEFDPDAYFLTGDDEPYTGAIQIQHQLPRDTKILYPGNAAYGQQEQLSIGNVDIIVCPEFNDLYDIRKYEQRNSSNTTTETIILSNLLSLNIEINSLTTTLEGLQRYKQNLKPQTLNGSYTHISGAIRAGYCRDWETLTVYGAGVDETSHGGSQFIALTISADGFINYETIESGKLGLQAINSVGPKTAERLEQNGLTTRNDVVNTDVTELTDIEGIGQAKAKTINQSARALTRNTVIHTSDTPVPANNPIFIDIETDGLNPTRVWLIGVKNGVGGNHMSFIETEIDANGEAVTAFMMWLRANAMDRTVMAWNGWNFDFPVIREHIQQHCPQYIDDWEQVSKRDPLRWARDLDNAILPGRTNKLEDVAEALGWDGHETELSGAEVARRMRRWIENPCAETELAWERHKQYCQDDVEALQHIYTAMENADRIISSNDSTPCNVEEDTVQTGLFDSFN